MRLLLGDEEAWAEARRTTLNAHYTPAPVIQSIWCAVGDLGFDGGRVLEPGCGSGNFIGLVPPGCNVVGIEADRTTASVARHLYGRDATIHPDRFEHVDLTDASFDLAIGNVPFAKVTPHDPRHNRGRHATGGSDISEVGELELTRGFVAERMARWGWPVLPCHHPENGACSCGAIGCASAGKHPRTGRGLLDATTDPIVVRRWWRAWPDANVAVRTGARPTGAGVVVIDIDDGGETSLDELASQHGPLPPTLEAATGGGGRHLYFAHPGGSVPNSAGRLGDGLDVRADRGYVLVAPSRHRSGGHYDWKCAPIATMPGWLSQLLKPPSHEPNGHHEPARTSVRVRRHVSAWAEAAVAGEVAAVRASVEGSRNHTLNRAAFKLGQLVGAGYLDAADIEDCLAEASAAVGLTARETRATIASGLRAGVACPRHPSTSD